MTAGPGLAFGIAACDLVIGRLVVRRRVVGHVLIVSAKIGAGAEEPEL
jgi:hypothetical protein